jgi:hypothetical protein
VSPPEFLYRHDWHLPSEARPLLSPSPRRARWIGCPSGPRVIRFRMANPVSTAPATQGNVSNRGPCFDGHAYPTISAARVALNRTPLGAGQERLDKLRLPFRHAPHRSFEVRHSGHSAAPFLEFHPVSFHCSQGKAFQKLRRRMRCPNRLSQVRESSTLATASASGANIG